MSAEERQKQFEAKIKSLPGIKPEPDARVAPQRNATQHP